VEDLLSHSHLPRKQQTEIILSIHHSSILCVASLPPAALPQAFLLPPSLVSFFHFPLLFCFEPTLYFFLFYVVCSRV